MRRPSLAQAAVALVWLYEGLWCKVIAADPHHRKVVESVPLLGSVAGIVLVVLGLAESALALWVLCGRWPSFAAWAQTILLVAMNAGGLLFARDSIPDPAGMVVMNLAFLALVWMVAAQARGRPA